jgi:cleavage and polyadenylation specificity factor subunit 2
VYATQPTVEMGRVVCLAEAESWRAECLVPEVEDDSAAVDDSAVATNKGKNPFRGPFVPTVEEIHEAFDWIKATRYNQPLHLGGMYQLQKCVLTSQVSCPICCLRPFLRAMCWAEHCSRSVRRHLVRFCTPWV